jgi:ABC-type xylose transport system permease subunit
MHQAIILLLAGAAGAAIKDILSDNALELPKFANGKICLGGIGGMLIGAAAGYYVDGSLVTAFLAGCSGSLIIQGVITKGNELINKPIKTVAERIAKVAEEEGVPVDLAQRVAQCESKFDQFAVLINTDGSRDRGAFQINSKYHPEVTDEQAFDVEFSTKFFCDAYKAGHLSWWNATKTCWDFKK